MLFLDSPSEICNASLFQETEVIEKGYKTEKTKRGFPTQLPIFKLLAGRKKIEVYQGLNDTNFKVGQSVEVKCSIMKVKSGNRISTKYILV